MCEPMYDDVALEAFAEMENKDLVSQLWQYILALEEYVVRLRNQVNLLADDSCKPYPDPASDFSIRFYDHPSYDKYIEILETEEPVWTIPD